MISGFKPGLRVKQTNKKAKILTIPGLFAGKYVVFFLIPGRAVFNKRQKNSMDVSGGENGLGMVVRCRI